MNLRLWKRPLIMVAVAAIVSANCFAPRLAHAARHTVPASDVVRIHHDDHAASMPGHEHSLPDPGDTSRDTSPYCCAAAACGATAFIFGSAVLHVLPLAEPISTAYVEISRQFLPSEIDPPPRLA